MGGDEGELFSSCLIYFITISVDIKMTVHALFRRVDDKYVVEGPFY